MNVFVCLPSLKERATFKKSTNQLYQPSVAVCIHSFSVCRTITMFLDELSLKHGVSINSFFFNLAEMLVDLQPHCFSFLPCMTCAISLSDLSKYFDFRIIISDKTYGQNYKNRSKNVKPH